MNAAAILSLISDLYGQVAALQQENEALRQALGEEPSGPAAPQA